MSSLARKIISMTFLAISCFQLSVYAEEESGALIARGGHGGGHHGGGGHHHGGHHHAGHHENWGHSHHGHHHHHYGHDGYYGGYWNNGWYGGANTYVDPYYYYTYPNEIVPSVTVPVTPTTPVAPNIIIQP